MEESKRRSSPLKYDVVVVGGGPSGLAAGLYAAKAGLKVKVFEKKKELGHPVRCGELFPPTEEMKRLLPGVQGLNELFRYPDECVDNRCSRIQVISTLGKVWEFKFRSDILDRHLLENYLADMVESHGGDVETSKMVRFFPTREGGAVGGTKTSSAAGGVIVAADGFPSETAEAAGLPEKSYMNPYSVATNIQYLMNGLKTDSDVAELYLDSVYAPGGYAWIIPKGDAVANVGTGVREPYVKREVRLPKLLDGFIKHSKVAAPKLRMGSTLSMVADVLPVDGPLERTCTERVMAVGDAAGMVMPTNGGGIPTALITGMMAGKAAVRKLENGESLLSYERSWKEQMGREMYNSRSMRRLTDKLMGRPLLFHLVLSALGLDRIKDVVTCQVPSGVGPVLGMAEAFA